MWPASAMRLSTCITDHASADDSPLVGSSRNSIFGRLMSSRPMETRRLSPPETPRTNGPPTLVSRVCSNPNSAITSITRSIFFAYVVVRGRLNIDAYRNVSYTVRYSNMVSSWVTYPDMRFIDLLASLSAELLAVGTTAAPFK
eukprot:CAMPEP_0184371782 /NCGR_PEP_ID=MMETSP1089-20130417/163591_1 /TAXON_ID=38269 ORGANISM="Gloeochaete wittrockiana, Strain SAG46.84" /NCGR_SAMPLE_ID=MMETSP1089 /ASSEMBLY_ACC=CAM_ASM_000445 /LENGTH=142 /DNA_ID=CAMNT_0026714577 /DNA_START=109 /DNA_END=537 /DNA_ORIENTATION=+